MNNITKIDESASESSNDAMPQPGSSNENVSAL